MAVFSHSVCFCLCFLIAFVYALGWFQMASLKTILVQATQCPPVVVEQTDIQMTSLKIILVQATASTGTNRYLQQE